MEPLNINPNLPCLRALTNSRRGKRRLSCSSPCSRSTHSSPRLSPTQSKNVIPIPILIELCMYPDEDYSYQTMKILLSPRYHYSPNVCDEFGCNVLMYTLRYQRYELFDFLLNEASFDIDLRSKDRQGNTILHYAVIYGKDATQIIENLIQKFMKFGIDVDARNILGFTPLLLAMFCGRYDVVLTLLTKTDASPFVGDYVQSMNILDFVEIDRKHKALLDTIENSRPHSQYPRMNRELTRLNIQLYKTLPCRSETLCQTIQIHHSVNFFKDIFPQAVHDRSGLIRLTILKMIDKKYSSSNLTHLVQYVNQRYPHISTLRNLDNSQRKPTPKLVTKIVSQCENSKTNVHNIFNLFDPDLRPKAMMPKVLTTAHSQLLATNARAPNTFKRLGTKLTVIAALSRSQTTNKAFDSIKTGGAK
ncbi:unnamed protein product [Rotaria socialis]|uniref:Uncharacterized protein n=1 Tax=Rotaria socialis TaxID=392032 RepID=A0A820B6J8_9BILA|nr:unnamed protein product [Rotaria socialis]CAF3297993.1 unnamed protein product [Rotaria socialis]CAF3317862.1 unnamed protein product [Rotaria socialis]CAF3318917.1 unnamed protein product [Rotaria socialis]CAF3357339.1 unnamed protein product [Rotaria socialis]